jgi:hypothetical protein
MPPGCQGVAGTGEPLDCAPHGPKRPAETRVRTAVGGHLLARRKPGVQIPSPPPLKPQVRASPAECWRRSLQLAAALRPHARVAVQVGRLAATRRLGPGPPTMTTERGRRLQPERRVRGEARQSGPEAHAGAGRCSSRSRIRQDGQTRGALLAVWLPAAPTRSTESSVQRQRTRTRNARTPMRTPDVQTRTLDSGRVDIADTGRSHRTRGHRTRGHRTVTPDTGHVDATEYADRATKARQRIRTDILDNQTTRPPAGTPNRGPVDGACGARQR